MLEARVTKAIVVLNPRTGKTELKGVAEYYGDAVNFSVSYDWETIDQALFIADLKERLAEDFELAVYRVDVQEEKLLDRMAQGYHMFKEAN